MYMIFTDNNDVVIPEVFERSLRQFCKQEGALHIHLQHYAFISMVSVNGDGLL